MSAAAASGRRASVVEGLAGALRERILDGSLPGGAHLREMEISREHGAARHSVRAALRELADEGLITVEPNRGARVAALDAGSVVSLYELRTALEVEAAHLALQRHGGRLPEPVHEAADRLAAVARRPRPSWAAVSTAHGELHHAIVAAARSPRIARAHQRLEAEIRLFLLQIKPHWTLERLADDHLKLVADLESRGPDVLRDHLRAAAAALVDEADLRA